jgi:hypothetical protein
MLSEEHDISLISATVGRTDKMTQECPKPPTARAKRWMLNEARRLRAEGKVGKRVDLLSRYKKDTGCTTLDAKAAYKNLPDELKYRRGKPPKARG